MAALSGSNDNWYGRVEDKAFCVYVVEQSHRFHNKLQFTLFNNFQHFSSFRVLAKCSDAILLYPLQYIAFHVATQCHFSLYQV